MIDDPAVITPLVERVRAHGLCAKFTDNVYLLHYAVHFPAAVCAPSMVRRGVGRVQGIFECYANGREAALRTLLARLDNHAAQL